MILIEDIYSNNDIDIFDIARIPITNLSHYDKLILGISSFSGHAKNNIYDAAFMLKIPFQIIVARYILLQRCKNEV